MEYNFTEDILDIIKQKTSDLFNKLNEASSEGNSGAKPLSQHFLEDFKLFHNDSRTNTSLLKYIIHKKIAKIEESDNIILFNYLKEFENNQEITELIWDYIHSVYLLHEYALSEPNKEILSALIKKINVENEDENNTSLTVIDENNYEEFMVYNPPPPIRTEYEQIGQFDLFDQFEEFENFKFK
jgi:hypothetical protein